MPIYSYNNGNLSSTTSILNNGTVLTQNIYNLGNQSGCNGSNTCTEGYGLYVPCIKTVIPGQDVCFEFYVTDLANQDVLDLRKVDALTLSLIGRYGCKYGDYKYPDNITFLQTYDYDTIFADDFAFALQPLCTVNVVPVDMEGNEIEGCVTGKAGVFYGNTIVHYEAQDTATHIFQGWIVSDADGDSDIEYVSRDKEYDLTVKSDTIVYVVYRERKEYTLVIDKENQHCHFHVNYGYKIGDGEVTGPYSKPAVLLSKPIYDKTGAIKFGPRITIKEGYHVVLTCIPNTVKSPECGNATCQSFVGEYEFDKWETIDRGATDQSIEIVLSDKYSDERGYVKLKCSVKEPSTVEANTTVHPLTPTIDVFNVGLIEEHDDSNVIKITYESYGYDKYVDYETITGDKVVYEGTNCYLKIENGLIRLMDKQYGETGRVSMDVRVEEPCVITVSANGEEQSKTINNVEFENISFDFLDLDENVKFEIKVDGVCYIDNISFDKTIINDKGKAQLCLSSEESALLKAGTLTMSGAVSVNGSVYGLPCTVVANVSNQKINLI